MYTYNPSPLEAKAGADHCGSLNENCPYDSCIRVIGPQLVKVFGKDQEV